MKRNSFLISCLLFIGFIKESFSMDLSQYSFKYFDDQEDLKFREEFHKNYTQSVTKGKVVFEYNELKGTHCKAAKNISSREFVFSIEGEFLICGFDIYPFKFELKELIYGFLSRKYQQNVNETKAKTALYLFAYKMMYHKLADKERVESYLKRVGKDYYISRLNEKQEAYLKSLPHTLYTVHMYDDEESKLNEYIGLPNLKNEVLEVFEFVEKHYRKHHLSDYIHHWINNKQFFKLYTGLISSRAYKTSLSEYEKLIGVNYLELPAGGQQKQLLSDVTIDFSWTCLLPFIDLCNHKQEKDPEGKDYTPFFVLFMKKKAMIGFGGEFKPGDEYEYSYLPQASNEKLLLSYGFYFKDNALSYATFDSVLHRNHFQKEKWEVCKKLGCLEYNYDWVYQDAKTVEIPIRINLFPHKINQSEPSQTYNATLMEKRLRKNKWLSYTNEIRAISLYHMISFKSEEIGKLNSTDIMHSIALTRDYYKKHREDIISNQFLRYKYRIRRGMFNVALENRVIYFKNAEFSLNEYSRLLTDQFTKFRTEILKEVGAN